MAHAGAAAARSGLTESSSQQRLSQRLHDAAERHGHLLIIAFLAVFLAASVGTAVRVRLWLDEIYTFFIANQPTMADMLRASYAGSDAQAPLFPFLVRAAHALVSNQPLALRLPSIAGFCTMAGCLFYLVRKRLGVLYALLATLIATCALLYYATEGRCYGVVLGCTALTLLFWQRATEEGKRRGWALLGLGLSASFAVAAQYYSVFFLGALFGAELIWAAWKRKADILLWTAILAPVGVLLPHLSLIRANRRFFLHFWSPASAHSATSFYDTFFAQHAWVLVAAVCLYVMAQSAPDSRPDPPLDLKLREWITYTTLAITPVLVVAFVLFTVKIYVPRYTIWAVPAIAMCIVAGLHKASGGSRLASLCGVLSFALLLSILEAENLHSQPHLRTGETTLAQLRSLPTSDQPIFVANHQIYLESWYYASPELRRRMYYAVDPNVDMHYGWPDTGPAVLGALRHWAPIQVPDLASFLAQHANFLLATDGRDWMPTYLLSLHYQLTPIRTDHTAGLESVSVLYDAHRP